MTGDSIIWLFSRVQKGVLSENNIVCFISKEYEDNRKFIHFAFIQKHPTKDKFLCKTFKRQEIPKHDNYDKETDTSEFSLMFIDDGSTTSSVEFTANKFKFKFNANIFIPFNETFEVIVGATGDLVTINNLLTCDLKKKNIVGLNDFADKQNCSCCRIF